VWTDDDEAIQAYARYKLFGPDAEPESADGVEARGVAEQRLDLRRALCTDLLRLNGARILSQKDVASIWSWSSNE